MICLVTPKGLVWQLQNFLEDWVRKVCKVLFEALEVLIEALEVWFEVFEVLFEVLEVWCGTIDSLD